MTSVDKTALNAAIDANSKEKIAQTDVDNALANLKAAIDGLKAPADKTALTAAIAKYGELEETDYTPMTWEALGTPLAKAMGLSAVILKAARSRILIPELPASDTAKFIKTLAEGEK